MRAWSINVYNTIQYDRPKQNYQFLFGILQNNKLKKLLKWLNLFREKMLKFHFYE